MCQRSHAAQVGTLDPGANADLAATLLISHPHEDTVYRQGSYLSSDAIAALEAMQRHVDLLELQEVIKERIMQLGNAGARLRASRAELCAGDGALAHRRQSGDTATSSAVGAAPSSRAAGVRIVWMHDTLRVLAPFHRRCGANTV